MKRLDFQRLFAGLFLLALICASCGRPAPEIEDTSPSPSLIEGPITLIRGLPQGELRISREGQAVKKFRVEIASTQDSRQTGLMGITELEDDVGMVFEFQAPHRGSFYMKNTLIPLDIAFWNASGTIVDILQMEPCKEDPCPLYTPSADYLYAVEVNKGVMASNGIRVGDKAELIRPSR